VGIVELFALQIGGQVLVVHEDVCEGDADLVVMPFDIPELGEKRDWVREVVAEEEARFERTLSSGLAILDEVIDRAREAGEEQIGGRQVFRLYDTYGFPPDLTRVVAEERGLTIDAPGFEAAMAEQRERARQGGGFAVGDDEEHYRKLRLADTEFLGYDSTTAEGRVVAVRAVGADEGQGQAVEVVLDRTPFYAEAGGQVGDIGTLRGDDGAVRVTGTTSPVPGVIVHHGVVEHGALAEGDTVTAQVDADRRADIARNHTATHLLHRALQQVLGEHAQQRGSLVAPDRLRFDFAHLKAVTPDELEQIERRVNEMVRADAAVSWDNMPLEDARRAGAMMLFGEKYGDTVRMVTVDDLSRELCGGTHLRRTGEIGLFLVRSESSVGAGLRRIEALTGRGAEEHVRGHLSELTTLATRLGAQAVEDVPARVEDLMGRVRELEGELSRRQAAAASSRAGSLADAVIDVGGVPVLAARIDAPDIDTLRGQVDALRDKLSSVVMVLGAVVDDKPRLIAAVTDDLVAAGFHAGDLVKVVARDVGGGGGGRPNMAEAGGKDPGRLDAALAAVPDHVRAQSAAASEPG
ncbi:MAG: alanine--tRNA ligase, partial [Anaerolineae bacterium]